jgi:hypothetical protein
VRVDLVAARVDHEAGEVLEQAQVALDEKDLLVEDRRVDAVLDVAGDGEARHVAALRDGVDAEGRAVVAVVEADPAGLVVVLSHEAGRVEARRVALRDQAERAALAELALVLRHRRAADGVAVLAEAVGREDLGARERVIAHALRPEEHEPALRVPRAAGVRRREAATRQPELEIGAPGDRVVALAGVERPLDDAHRLDELRDDEVRVGVAVAVEVAALVDGHAVDRELEVLALAGVEPAEQDGLGVAGAALVREDDGRGGLEHGRGGRDGRLVRHPERADAEVDVGRADLGGRRATVHVDLLDFVRLRRRVPSRRRRGRRRGGGGGGGGGGGAGGAKWNGILIRAAIGLPFFVAGENVHLRTASTAASSNAAPPEVSIFTLVTLPSASSVTSKMTSECWGAIAGG